MTALVQRPTMPRPTMLRPAMLRPTMLRQSQIRVADQRSRALGLARQRVAVVIAIFAMAGLVMLLRILALGLFAGTGTDRTMAQALLPPRGDIVDRNGQPLARAFSAYALWYNPKALDGADSAPAGHGLVGDADDLARKLAGIFPDTPASDFRRMLTSDSPGYLRRRLLPEQANAVHALGEPAFEFPRESERFYPHGSLAAHVLGYVDSAGQGKIGMEQALNQQLTDPATRGQPAMLAIDLRVQGALEDELGRAMLANNAVGAAGIVMDVDTGEVMALASLPAFNPNKINSDINQLVFNKVTNQVYELGSTFKPISIASAIDNGVVTDLSIRYNATEPLKVGKYFIRDSHSTGRYLNVPEALVHSSNIVTARIADNLGSARLMRTMRDLSFHERPYIELPARGMPLWPSSWGRVTNMTVAYGHGIAVTPIHLASGYAALVNGGIWRPATLRKVPDGQLVNGRRVFKASTSAQMNKILRMIVVDGTGKKADAPGFRVGGKTGTAEKPTATGGYSRGLNVATFAAAFPMDKPRYVLIIMLDEPKGTAESGYGRTAGLVAAPVVARVVPRIGPFLGVVPDDRHDVDVSELTPLLWKPKGEL